MFVFLYKLQTVPMLMHKLLKSLASFRLAQISQGQRAMKLTQKENREFFFKILSTTAHLFPCMLQLENIENCVHE